MAKIPSLSSHQTQMLSAVKEMMVATLEYQKIKETETTKRAEIESLKQEKLEKIRADKDVLLKIIETKHIENMTVIHSYLDKLDEAIESKNAQMVSLLLSGISDTLRNNPFSSIKDMTDENGRLQIEL
jgi:hypothetical protein